MKHRLLCSLFLVLLSPAVARADMPSIGDDLDRLLGLYVVDERWLDYAAWFAHEKDRAALREVVRRMENVVVEDLSREEQLAFWINLYNAATVDLVLDRQELADESVGREVL